MLFIYFFGQKHKNVITCSFYPYKSYKAKQKQNLTNLINPEEISVGHPIFMHVK